LRVLRNHAFKVRGRPQIKARMEKDVNLPDPPSVEFAGYSRRWVRRRTSVRQAPTNKEDSVKSADPKGQKNEEKKISAIQPDRMSGFIGPTFR
jgi:hypothetical protein